MAEPTTERRAELRALHQRHDSATCINGERCGRKGRCDWNLCDQTWPCETIILLDIADERDRLRAAAQQLEETYAIWRAPELPEGYKPGSGPTLDEAIFAVTALAGAAGAAGSSAPEPQEGGR